MQTPILLFLLTVVAFISEPIALDTPFRNRLCTDIKVEILDAVEKGILSRSEGVEVINNCLRHYPES